MDLRIAGVLLMLAGWVLILAAIIMLTSLPARTAFSVAGFGVEILGFLLLARAYIPARKKSHA